MVSVSVAHGGSPPLLLSAHRGTDVQSLIRAEETEAEMEALNEEALWKHHFRADRFDAPPLDDDALETGDGRDGGDGGDGEDGMGKGGREEVGGYALRLGSFREEGRYEGGEGGGDGRGSKASRAGVYGSPRYALPVDEVYYASYSYYAYSISESGE